MSFAASTSDSSASSLNSHFVTGSEGNEAVGTSDHQEASPFRDRRSQPAAGGDGTDSRERRQFGSSHAGLSEDGRELAAAIDCYKLEHHRRYITCDEMLAVLKTLGYQRNEQASSNNEQAS